MDTAQLKQKDYNKFFSWISILKLYYPKTPVTALASAAILASSSNFLQRDSANKKKRKQNKKKTFVKIGVHELTSCYKVLL